MGKWRVDVFRDRLLQLGTVIAPNAHEALIQAYNLFHIDPGAQHKVTITKLEPSKPKRMHTSSRYSIS